MKDLRFYDKLDQIDKLINSVGENGYKKNFTKIAVYLDNPHICNYFFEKIDNDEGWLGLVTESEFIQKYRSGNIPNVDNYQFDWFTMGYLLKIADKKPDQVAAYLKSFPLVDEERLHNRIIEVLLKLPCNLAASIANNEVEWCKSRDNFYGLNSDLAGKLLLHLQGCNEDVAFELIKVLLDVNSIENEIGDHRGGVNHKRNDVKIKFSDYEYQTLLDRYFSSFIMRSKDYKPVLEYLYGVMSYILELESGSKEVDHSWIWRNTLEDNDQTRHISGIKEHVLVSLRDVSIVLIKDDNSRFDEIIHILSNFKSAFFRRLSIYISAKFPEINLELTKDLLRNTSLYDDPISQNEYSLLLANAFEVVDDDDRQTVYDWIEGGPNIEDYKSSTIEHTGKEPTEEVISTRVKYWKKNRLYLIKKHLNGYWLEQYNSLVEGTGEPEHPEYSSYTTSWVGPTSPKSVEDLNELSVSELISFLNEWTSSGKSMEASPEGLSRNVSEVIQSNTDKYKLSASLFIGLQPTYVRGVIQGFKYSINNLDDESWSGLFDLLEWVLSQELVLEEEHEGGLDEDSDWSWCRQSIASLLDDGLKKDEGRIPIILRDRVWNIILVLTEDPEPTPEYEEKYGGNNMDPVTLSINTVRGEAMHALVNYGLWIKRKITDKNICFDDIPEMVKILDKHLIPEKDPSLAIRSVYGQFYPWLNLLDPNWANEAKYRIFSNDDIGLGDAAWGAYINFCQPYDDIFKVIPDIYGKYAKELSDNEQSDERDQTLENFAAHLMSFYWRSKLELGDEVLHLFYENAPVKIRKYAIEFIGRSLGHTSDALEPKVEERLKALYEWRQSYADKSKEYEELGGFCWWMDADIIDKSWALNKFHELLKVSDKLYDLSFATKKLRNYLAVDSEKVLECVDMMLDKLNQHGNYFTWDEEAQEILRESIASENIQAKEKAIDLVHKFGSKGVLKYRELLNIQ